MATPMPNEKSALVQVRLTGAEKRSVEAASARNGMTVSECVRLLMRRAADEASNVGNEGPTPDRDSKPQRRRR